MKVKTAIISGAAGILAVAVVATIILRFTPLIGPSHVDSGLKVVRYGVSPFQDTFLPIVGRERGWYEAEGLDVRFRVLGWAEVMEALSAGHIDVAINNISSVIATHENNPEIIYWYGFNTFDNGFALMIRPGAGLRTLHQVASQMDNRDSAIQIVASQLRGKRVITTGNTDMEQGVAAAARRGGLNFSEDVTIIDMNPDEGLAAFLRGEGDAYIGGIPQRTRAGNEGMLEMLSGADLGPAPINGIVTTKSFASDNEETLLKLLRVWFRIVNFIDGNMEEGSRIVIDELNANTGAQFTVADFRRFWNNFEHYPATPSEVEQTILSPDGSNYWRARWDDTNHYFVVTKRTISAPVSADDAFWMLRAHRAYVERYGRN